MRNSRAGRTTPWCRQRFDHRETASGDSGSSSRRVSLVVDSAITYDAQANAAVVSLSSAWLALIAGAVVVALVALDVMFHGASHELLPEDDITPHHVTIDLDKRAK